MRDRNDTAVSFCHLILHKAYWTTSNDFPALVMEVGLILEPILSRIP